MMLRLNISYALKLSVGIFYIGIFGLVLNRINILIAILCIELLLLALEKNVCYPFFNFLKEKVNLPSSFLLICDAPDFWQFRLQDPANTLLLCVIFISITVIVIVSWLLLNSNYKLIKSKSIKSTIKLILELAVPILVFFISLAFLGMYTLINNPYTIEIQTVVFISSLLLNLGILSFYKSERKLSFMFFFFNILLIFTYMRLSSSFPFPLYLIYYFGVLFIGFHIFEKTFTKRFFLRTKIILTGYYNNSEFIKIILWLFLVLLPSLINHPIMLFSVCQPLMIFCYLSEHDYILFFITLLLLWCLLLFLMNKYEIARNFLEKCLAYFSRRACLHYVGNMFGRKITKIFETVTPFKVVTAMLQIIGIAGVPSFIEHRLDLSFKGHQAAEEAGELYVKTCLENSVKVNPCVRHHKQSEAFCGAVKESRLGKYYLDFKVVGLKTPEDVKTEEFARYCQGLHDHEVHGLIKPVESFEELKHNQMQFREEYNSQFTGKHSGKCPTVEDLHALCKRALNVVAREKQLELNSKTFDNLVKGTTRDELIKYTLNEIDKSDAAHLAEYERDVNAAYLAEYERDVNARSQDYSQPSTLNVEAGLLESETTFRDVGLLDNPTGGKSTKVALNINLLERPPLNQEPVDFGEIFIDKKRSIGESQSTDSNDTPSSESSSKKPKSK